MIEAPVRPTDDVLLGGGTKSLDSDNFYWDDVPAHSFFFFFSVVSRSPTSLQHTALFRFSVSVPTVTFCFKESERKTERSNKLAIVRKSI